MIRRLILLTGSTQVYASGLLKGILEYSKGTDPWVVVRMPSYYKQVHGIAGVVGWAKDWKADAIIGQFEPTDNVSLFGQYGIVAVAQDYQSRFKEIPNLTGDYVNMGRMAAQYFIQKGFRNFAFYGFNDVVWSDERSLGFRSRLLESGLGDRYYEFLQTSLNTRWYYDADSLAMWLLSLPRPVALFACDDNSASRIVEVCRTRQVRIPEDVAVLGVNNDDVLCNLSYPSLSSISLDVERGGYDVAQLIDTLLSDPHSDPHDVVVRSVNIVERMSTDIYATDDAAILKVLHYIHQHLSSPLSVQELVEQVPMSRRLLEMRFKAATGQSIHQYILDLRMERFSQLLLSSDEPIQVLAMDLGLQEPKNTARQFKARKGMTPAEYRKRFGPK